MRQSAQSLFWLVLLAFLPGCALFGGGSAIESPRKVSDQRDWEGPQPEKDKPTITAPGFQEPRPPEKLAVGPPPVAIPLVDPSAMGVDPAKRSPASGMVNIEPLFEPNGIQKAAAQGPPPPAPINRKSELAPFVLAGQLMMEGRHQEAIDALRAYDEETQELFIRIMPILTLFGKTSINKVSSADINMLESQLEGLRAILRNRCELLVARMQFCRDIKGFGNYDPLPDNYAFLNATNDRPGELVQIYVELKNFASVKGKDGMYLTKLACSLELRDSNNKRVGPPLRFDEKKTTYRRSACLNDYHGNFSFYVPPIPAGTYKLILQIFDETIPNERRCARKELDFRVTPVANQTTLRGE